MHSGGALIAKSEKESLKAHIYRPVLYHKLWLCPNCAISMLTHCWFEQSDNNTSTYHNRLAWFLLPRLLINHEKRWQLVRQTWSLKGSVPGIEPGYVTLLSMSSKIVSAVTLCITPLRIYQNILKTARTGPQTNHVVLLGGSKFGSV